MAIAPSTIFLSSDAVATICLLLSFVRLLFEGGIHFFENPTDINDGWIRYIQVRRWWLLDAVSSTCNLSVLLSAVGTTRTTQIALSASLVTVVRNYSDACACAACTSCGYYSRAAFFSFRASDCVATIRGWQLFKGAVSIWRNTVLWGLIVAQWTEDRTLEAQTRAPGSIPRSFSLIYSIFKLTIKHVIHLSSRMNQSSIPGSSATTYTHLDSVW